MKKFSEKLINVFIEHNIIDEKDCELYVYGASQAITMLLNFITIIVIGIIFDMLWQSVLFTITYIPIRTYAGGFHCRTPIKCYIFSVIMQIIILFLLKINFLNDSIIILLISLFGSILSILLAPVEDINKKLDNLEIKVFRKKAIINIVIIQILTFLTLKFTQFSLTTSLAICCSAFMLVLGKIYNFRYYKNLKKVCTDV